MFEKLVTTGYRLQQVTRAVTSSVTTLVATLVRSWLEATLTEALPARLGSARLSANQLSSQ
jgi:hypothetical protein